jgi:hypothetical protein
MRAPAAIFLVVACSALAACRVLAQDAIPVAKFSAFPPGKALPPGWREQRLPRARPAEVGLVADEGVTVLRVRSNAAAGGAIHPLPGTGERQATRLAWRWKVDRVVEGADMTRRDGDDFAARVYVFFAIPVDELPFGERFRIMLARLIYGAELPTAGICYVWDNRHPAGYSAWSPFTKRIRMVVVETGPDRAGQWVEARRDLEADFRAAFGAQWDKPTPPVSGVAAGNDTDQTGESATAWFGDFSLEARR